MVHVYHLVHCARREPLCSVSMRDFFPRIACHALGLIEVGWVDFFFSLLEVGVAVIIALYVKRVIFAVASLIIVWRIYLLVSWILCESAR